MKKKLALLIVCAAALGLVCRTGGESVPTGGGGVVKVPQDPSLVALTFDDGPRADTTGPLLEGLALREVPATFFLLGHRIPGNEGLVKEMAAAGHQIGIHTWDHVMLSGVTAEEFYRQTGQTRDLLAGILGERDYWLRPPYGIMDPELERLEEGPLIIWSVDPEDWKDRDVERIVNEVLSQAEDGDIILMHDIYPSSVEAALAIVDALLDRGFCFVTVEQLMDLREVEPQAGVRYDAVPF